MREFRAFWSKVVLGSQASRSLKILMPTQKERGFNRKKNLHGLRSTSAFRQCTVASLRRTSTSSPVLVSSACRLSTAVSASVAQVQAGSCSPHQTDCSSISPPVQYIYIHIFIFSQIPAVKYGFDMNLQEHNGDVCVCVSECVCIQKDRQTHTHTPIHHLFL